jgi:hypothetical protein
MYLLRRIETASKCDNDRLDDRTTDCCVSSKKRRNCIRLDCTALERLIHLASFGTAPLQQQLQLNVTDSVVLSLQLQYDLVGLISRLTHVSNSCVKP